MSEKMHNFEQVRDVLDYGIRLHGRLHDTYQQLYEQSEKTRVKMVLDYLSRHERNRATAMKRFEEGAHEAILDMWLQYAPSSAIEKMLENCGSSSQLDVDGVVRLALCFDEALIALYRETGGNIDDPHVQDLFRNLAEMESQERQRFVRDAEWVQDI